ncbi:uncharacterized protein LOC18017639 isoform X2 [Eutrema salsugineum]|uniref:uncharacterized protein LOC18017639 isoform X2 n=1 Tax=Eutrema salsugineum TaxID=72664 RepID=UPI000CED71AA|nr:uncharacterized protein LOC18017639 isoform X2 [Eutrema salsugineum]
MSNSTNETLEDGKGQFDDKITNVNQRTEPSQEWETMARAWITAFPDAKAVISVSEVETWIGSNFDSLPADLRHRPRSELVDRLLSMQHYMRPTPSDHNEQNGEENQTDQHPARFQRTDQWLPVYSWLESLDNGELVKSKDITEWLDANPEVKEELSSRHSRYHLTHYVKKCHLKILKRKEKKGLIRLSRATAMEVHKEFGEKHSATLSADPMSNVPKDSDLYRTKQKEAKRRFEILVELEKKLAPHFSRPRIANR